eukprot:3763107-Pyramimonas_sp.AAC.1
MTWWTTPYTDTFSHYKAVLDGPSIPDMTSRSTWEPSSHQKAPTITDVINLNRVLKWVKRMPCVIRFEKLLPPLRVLVISDSAFKREN